MTSKIPHISQITSTNPKTPNQPQNNPFPIPTPNQIPTKLTIIPKILNRTKHKYYLALHLPNIKKKTLKREKLKSLPHPTNLSLHLNF